MCRDGFIGWMWRAGKLSGWGRGLRVVGLVCAAAGWREVALGLTGTETQLYLVEGEKATKLPGLAGSYAGLEAAKGAGAILVRHSTINEPTQVYLASDPMHPDKLTALTNFNRYLRNGRRWSGSLIHGRRTMGGRLRVC